MFLIPLILILTLPTIVRGECKAEGPFLMDKVGKQTWLDTPALIKQSQHCVAPRLPAMAQNLRIQGQVLVDILVNERGKVACVQFIHGHPILASSAIDAAKSWTFRPMKQAGKAVSFYGHMTFTFSTSGYPKGESACIVAHW